MIYFFAFILCLSHNCLAMDDPVTKNELKEIFFKKISYKFENTLDIPYIPNNPQITPITVLPFCEELGESVPSNFENEVWRLTHFDQYLEASYLWYIKLKMDNEFTFNNLREFYWCLIGSNNYTNIVVFTEGMLKELKSIEGISSSTPPL